MSMWLEALGQIQKVDNSNKRRCSCCREYKDKSDFSVKDKLRGWLDTRCKSCKTQQALAKNKEKKANHGSAVAQTVRN